MNDDDDFDFQALFFEECHELLGTLQEHLNQLADGRNDEETVHAAFRAVHSVKGGAAAFGFDQLIGFAHIFETVMDLIRSDQMAPTAEIHQILLRSGDMMEVLIESAENSTPVDEKKLSNLQGELELLASGKPGAEDAAEEYLAPPAATPPQDAAAPEAPDGPEAQEITVRFTPEAEFFSSGHDPLRLIRAAKQRGLTKLEILGHVPPLDAFNPAICPLTWELMFETDGGVEDLEDFFEIYSHIAEIEFATDTIDVLEEVEPEAEPPAPEPEAGLGAPGAPGGAPRNSEFQPAEAPAAPIGLPGKARGGSSKSLRVELPRID
ncbi:MAG: Hpt domain-containing protein, partial [Pseudomonadota bacterium]